MEPIRIVRTLNRMGGLQDGDPYDVHRVRADHLPGEGHATAVTPGTKIEYAVPDMYGRPWAQNWEEHYEQGMKRPDADEALFKFE